MKIQTQRRRINGSVAAGAAATVFALVLGAVTAAAANGDYTQAQASAGKSVYDQNCAQCHGSNLQGGSGPALSGKAFASSLSYSKMSAQQLFDFIKTHMPANSPGSLSDEQYRETMAYILSHNGYPAGSTPLSAKSLKSVKLLPYPGSGSKPTH